jgi:hypothetical protein
MPQAEDPELVALHASNRGFKRLLGRNEFNETRTNHRMHENKSPDICTRTELQRKLPRNKWHLQTSRTGAVDLASRFIYEKQ